MLISIAKRCLKDSPNQIILLREDEIELNVILEFVSKLCYLGDKYGGGGGVKEAARLRVRDA